jgi:heterodisulfide reductase subunit C
MKAVETADESSLEALIKSNYIWLCGECMSCKPVALATILPV